MESNVFHNTTAIPKTASSLWLDGRVSQEAVKGSKCKEAKHE